MGGAEQRRAAAGGELPGLLGAYRGAVSRLVLLEQREHLHLGEEVERVVGAGAVGAEPDLDAGGPGEQVGEDAADRELEVGHGVGDDHRAAGCDQFEL